MKLADAKVCVECDEILPAGVEACPSCTCSVFFHLSAKIHPMLTREQLDRIRMERKQEGQ